MTALAGYRPLDLYSWSRIYVRYNRICCSDIFVNENENENENYCAFVHENENENFLKNENRIRTKINLSERIEINY
jgi:hypothetical protein